MKLPFMKYYPTDWTLDTRILSLEARGAWIDILGALWHSKTRGQLTLPAKAWASILGTNEAKFMEIANELKTTEVADVTFGNSDVTLISRRILREEKQRSSTKERVERFRNANVKRNSNAMVTAEMLDTRSQKLETIQKQHLLAPPAAQAAPDPEADTTTTTKKYNYKKDPISKIIYAYKLVCGVALDDRTWDQLHWARCRAEKLKNGEMAYAAPALLAIHAGDWGKAVDYMSEFEKDYRARGLSFTLETMVKKYHEFKEDKNHENKSKTY